jgi:hypothetical protein
MAHIDGTDCNEEGNLNSLGSWLVRNNHVLRGRIGTSGLGP